MTGHERLFRDPDNLTGSKINTGYELFWQGYVREKVVGIGPYFAGLIANLHPRVRQRSQINCLQPRLVIAASIVQDLPLKHDLVHIETQNRVGGNLVHVPKGKVECSNIDGPKQYTCCKVVENRMDNAEGLQGLDVGMIANLLPYFIR